MDFMNTVDKQGNVKLTANGAVALDHTKSALVDINFKVPELRRLSLLGSNEPASLFSKAFSEDNALAMKWLLFLRDVRGGIGERTSFRSILKANLASDPTFVKMLKFVPEFGRYDDIIDCIGISSAVDNEIVAIIKKQLDLDILNCDKGEMSLLAKWMPSENCSSKDTKRKAAFLRNKLGYSPAAYRKLLTKLRKQLKIVETLLCDKKWGEIDYSAVPSKANLKYNDAFMRHDMERRTSFLEDVENGQAKINSNACFPHDIVQSYNISEYNHSELDKTLEAMWDALKKFDEFNDTLVVRDGSGSMDCCIPGAKNTTALRVADAITLYCCRNNTGSFKDKFITFSSEPEIVNISKCKTLRDKLIKLCEYDDCSNTNIEATFDLILNAALDNNLEQKELPKSILIISDMEFDDAINDYRYRDSEEVRRKKKKLLFDGIKEKFNANGYEMPKLVFWNVNSSTGAIPIEESDNGVCLISGFSANLLELVCSLKLDPYDILVEKLTSGRYDCIDSII